MSGICKILESLSFAAETYFCEFLSYPNQLYKQMNFVVGKFNFKAIILWKERKLPSFLAFPAQATMKLQGVVDGGMKYPLH